MSNNEKNVYYANSAIGIAGGYSAYKYLPVYIKKPILSSLLNKCKKIPPKEHSRYWYSATEAFVKSSSFNPKIQMVDINTTNCKAIIDDIIQKRNNYHSNLQKKSRLKAFLIRTLSMSDEKLIKKMQTLAKGRNASYFPSISTIYVNSEKMGISTFHELGHAINHNGKGIRKILGIRGFSPILFPAVLGIGLFTPKREEGDEYKNPFGKTATFIKEHCGVLAGLSLAPIVLEEGVASINGAKLAKTVLDKTHYNKLNKFNAAAFGSYVFSAVMAGTFTALAVYIKDRISGTAPVKNAD